MPRLEDLQEKRNKLMTDAAAQARKEGITAEERSQVDAMLADVDQLEIDINLEQRFVNHEKTDRSHTPPPRLQPGDNSGQDDTKELREKRARKAFEQYTRFGASAVDPELRKYMAGYTTTMTDAERRDLGVGTPGTGVITGGAQLVPQLFDNELIQAQKTWGQLLDEVKTVRTESGAQQRFSYANDTANGLVEIPEMNTSPEVDPAFAPQLSNTVLVSTGWVKVSIQELNDAAFDLGEFMKDIFGQRWYRGAVNKITNGSLDGSSIQSILAAGSFGSVTSVNDTAITYADFVALYAALEPAYMGNAKFEMNSKTRGAVMGLVDGFGRPLFLPSTASGAPDTILGRPIIVNQALPNIPAAKVAGVVPIQFGDFKQAYRFRIVTGNPLTGTAGVAGELAMIREEHLFIGTLEVGFQGIARIGGNCLNAGVSPLVNLTMNNA